MNTSILRQVLVVVAVIATIVVNGLATALPINNQTTGEISDRFDVFFVPAGYVFSIWGVIYLGLVAYAIYQAFPAQRDNPRLARIAPWFILSCVANSIWIFLWHYEQFVLTIVAMLTLLVSLIAVYVQLGIGRTAVSSGEKWLVRLPFSIYLGWVSVATIANITSTLDWVNWGGWGISEQSWAVIMLVVAVVLALLVERTRRDIAYILVFVWAFIGIGVEQSDATTVATAAYIAAGLLAVLAVVSFVMRQRESRVAV
jgi:translocator protein